MGNSFWKSLSIVLLSLSCLCSYNVLAQEKGQEEKPLVDLLVMLEQRYQVRFSYRDQDLADIRVPVPKEGLPLRQTLKILEQKSPVLFEILNERYIAVIRTPREVDFCGIVMDSTTGQQLVGATITNADFTATAVTDPTGSFRLQNLPPGTELQIQYFGYKDFSMNIPENNSEVPCMEIHMEPALQELQETVVINYLTSGISKRKDGATYINTERFGTLPGQTAPDVLQTVASLPGVESVNETISNINIRGGTSDQNLILFDGIKMYLTGHFFGLISAFNPNLTKEVLVTKNGSSPHLNDGVSGTIQIFSKDEITGELSGGFGLDMVSADAFLQVPVTKDFAIHVSGRRSINDWINTPTYSNYFSRTFQGSQISPGTSEQNQNNSSFQYYDTSLKFLYDLSDDHKVRFSLMQVDNSLNYSELSSQSENSRESSLAQKNLALGTTWKANWNSDLSSTATAYLSHYRLNAVNHTIETDQRLEQGNEVLETGLKLHLSKKLSSSFDFMGGYQFYEVGVSNTEFLNNPFFRSTIKNVIRSHSGYAEGKYSGQNSFLKVGLRLNYITKFQEFLFEPRLSFNQQLGRKFSFKVLAETKSQSTSQIIDLQEDFLGVENRRWILADKENYPLIRSKQVSGGFDFKDKGWYLDLEAYFKHVEGINTSNQGFQDQHEFIRTSGSYTAQGIELLVNKKSGAFHTFLTYSFGTNDYHFQELSPADFPSNFDIRHSGSMAVNYSQKPFKFALGAYLRNGKPYTRPVPGNETRLDGNNWVINYQDPNSSRLPNFFRVDFSSSYNFEFPEVGNLIISVGILNLLDRHNVINRYYTVDPGNPDEAVEIQNSSLGFTPNGSIRFTF